MINYLITNCLINDYPFFKIIKWEVIIARRTGTTYSVLDYVVYRLFYVLTLCGASVYKLSQVNPLPFLIYFEVSVIINLNILIVTNLHM